MHEQVTLLPPDAPTSGKGLWSGLPPDLMDQVRSRVRVLALIFLIAFSFDPLLYLLTWIVATVLGYPVTFGNVGFRVVDLSAVAASLAIWFAAKTRAVSAERLHTIGLMYEVAICLVIALVTFWQYYNDKGVLPSLTWVPAVVILFPLILPGPPARMLVAAILAGAMAPLGLLALALAGKVPPTGGDYFEAIVSSSFAVAFAYLGARVVYRLGREVIAARELGSYRLEGLLGKGGMGEVWRARHRMLARPAAIKLIRPQLIAGGVAVSTDLARRFEREAQVIARLRSPHTVDLFDFGIADNGAFYYVMELLDGLDTDRLVRRFGPVSTGRAIFLLQQICHSLSEAQSYGLVHRDIKPANIFVCRYGEDCDFVKVLDFGLVKAFQDTDQAELTRENVVQGTPAFIAPEQALGRASLDSRVDIYAIGCVAFWLVTGQLVFTAENMMGLLLHHVHTKPEAPSTRTDLPIPAALDDLILACLAKSPGDRPQSPRELSERLCQIEVPGEWTQQQAREWWGRYQPNTQPSAKEPASMVEAPLGQPV